jgi:hypothetical protein
MNCFSQEKKAQVISDILQFIDEDKQIEDAYRTSIKQLICRGDDEHQKEKIDWWIKMVKHTQNKQYFWISIHNKNKKKALKYKNKVETQDNEIMNSLIFDTPTWLSKNIASRLGSEVSRGHSEVARSHAICMKNINEQYEIALNSDWMDSC